MFLIGNIGGKLLALIGFGAAVALRIRSCVRRAGIVACLGADECNPLRYRPQQPSEALHQQQRVQSEQLHAALDEHAIVSITDLKGKIIHVNDRFCAISGYHREELLGQNHRIVKSDTHPPEFYRELWHTISAGQTWYGEVCNRRKNGELYWVEATIVPILDDQGKPKQYISIRTDVTMLKHHEEALRLSDERLRRSQVFANIGTWDWDVQTGEMYWSERIAPLFGYPTGELETSYENFIHADHPEDRQKVIDAVNACIERDVPYEIEHRVVWPDGTVRWLQSKGAVVRDLAGRPLHMLGVVQDIHGRKIMEAALVESEARFRGAFETAGIGMALVSLDGRWLQVNRALCAMLDYSEEELLATDFQTITHPDDHAADRSLVGKFMRNEIRSYQLEKRYHAKSGQVVWVLLDVSLVHNAGEQPLHFVCQVQDITQRKATKQRLTLFRRIFDASAQCVGIADGQGRLIYQNRAYAQELGYSDEEIAGQSFTIFLPDEEADAVVAEIMRSVAAGKSWVGKVPIRRKDASVFISASNVGFVKDTHQQVQYFFNIFTDFSEELARRNEFAQAKEAAERANQAKSNFLSSMSHELRTPMNAILGFAQMLEYDNGLNPDQQDNVHEILKGGRHLLALINEVLDLAKIESGSINLSLEPVDLANLIEDCRDLIQPLAAARQIILRLEVPPHMTVRADRVRLKQVLLNLLSNAVKYNREGGDIRLDVVPAITKHLRITVTDTGAGIHPEHMLELFEPFNRLDAEQSGIEGTGIGLTITRQLVEFMGGKVGVDSQVGVGTTFWIELPTDAAATLDAAVEAEDAAPQPDVPVRPYRVLCIDDNPVNLKLIAQMLGMRRHVKLVTAHTPQLGIELALSCRPELILLDINMPGMDGYQVLEVLKADPHLQAIPVIAITANAMHRDTERGHVAGFTEYITKPVDIDQFLKTMDRCLAGGEENAV